MGDDDKSQCKADNGSLDIGEAVVVSCQPINCIITHADETISIEDCREEYNYRLPSMRRGYVWFNIHILSIHY